MTMSIGGLPALADFLAGGFGLGLLHFAALWWTARRLAARRGQLLALALSPLRVLGVAAALVWVGSQSPLGLLLATLGLLFARHVAGHLAARGPA